MEPSHLQAAVRELEMSMSFEASIGGAVIPVAPTTVVVGRPTSLQKQLFSLVKVEAKEQRAGSTALLDSNGTAE